MMLTLGANAEQNAADDRAIREAQANWLSYGLRYDEQRFSTLTQINHRNVSRLALDWALDLRAATSLVSTPLAVDGKLYFSGDRAIVRAVDARDGSLLWTFDPEVWKHSPRGMAGGFNTHRGIAYLNGRIFFGTTDGRVIALDANSGVPIWTSRTFEPDEEKAITSAPRVFNNIVVIGHGGAEYGTRGYVDAFNAENGDHLWRFYAVPGNPADGFESPAMAMAAKTWAGEWWKFGGGGTIWNAMTYDEELDLLYIGTGNGGPWDYEERSKSTGDNLFLASIVALKPDTGEYVWHYQVNPQERWDYKATMDMVLADLVIDGKPRKVLMQAPTNGFFYVIDRLTGRPISAEKYTKVTWAERIDLETGRPVMTANADYSEEPKIIYPGTFGGHNWQPMSYNPDTGLVYVPTINMPARYQLGVKPTLRKDFFNFGVANEYFPPDSHSGYGSLLAWDPVAQQARWEIRQHGAWHGGTMTTAGNLVFQGNAEGEFVAFDARNGAELWSMNAQRGISAPPITYTVDGKQHVAVLVGWGGLASFSVPVHRLHGWKYKDLGIRLLSFSLHGTASLPDIKSRRHTLNPVVPRGDAIDDALASAGISTYHYSSCAVCHGQQAISTGGIAPDLRESDAINDDEMFKQIVVGGALLANGMPQFTDLSDAELLAVQMYLRQQAKIAYDARQKRRKPQQDDDN